MGRHGGHPSLKRTLTLEGCGPSQPRNPIKANIGRMPRCGKTKFPTLGACLVAAKRSSRRSARRRGTGALQVSIKVPIVVF